jgi:pimeloyl-ACP methyl ester carboxylesterase
VRLVLLPGLDGTGILFEPFVEALRGALEPVIVSYPPNQVLAYEELLEFVVRALPDDVPFAILGESFSGPLALMAAARRPRGLVAVVLCASFVRSPVPWYPRVLRGLVARPLFELAPSFAKRAVLLGSEGTPKLREMLEHALSAVAPEVMAARARAILGVDATPALLGCAVPLLYLQAAADRMVSAASWKLISKHRPDASLEVLPGPHLLLQTHPVEAATAIERFLRSSTGGPHGPALHSPSVG